MVDTSISASTVQARVNNLEILDIEQQEER